MSITEEINLIKEQMAQVKAAIECRNGLKGIYASINQLEGKVNRYIDNTGFDSIPAETKQALNRIYQMCLQLKTAIENDAAFEDLIKAN